MNPPIQRESASTARATHPVLNPVTSQERPADGTIRAVLVGVDVRGAGLPFDDSLDELAMLATSAGDQPVARLVARRNAPDAALFVGSGKADEIKALVDLHQAHGVIFDQALSPAQQRNLERHLGVPVADRTALILEIFAARAKSHEGKLQVKLARLQYLATRLVRRWSHLERQRGGIGTRGGPGEAQIELDRRMLGERIKSLKARLDKVKRQRGTQRRARERSGALRVALVGYTNAGKSTLFNALVKADAFTADRLFATLDTTTRELWLEGLRRRVVLSDTVGFIRALPHKLVEAFEATLQEATDADLLLHVVDAASPARAEQVADVERVLDDIGACGIPQVLVFNKCDLLDANEQPRAWLDHVEREGGVRVPRVFVSAATGQGLDMLRFTIARAAGGSALESPAIDDVTADSAPVSPATARRVEGGADDWPRTGT